MRMRGEERRGADWLLLRCCGGCGRVQDELRGLYDIFCSMEPCIVEAFYKSCDKQSAHALQQLMNMVGNTPQLNESLRKEAFHLHKVPAP